MNTVTISKEFTWDMAHMLAGHQGLCRNLHGHTYRMQVRVTRAHGLLTDKDSSACGMVMDFSDLKRVVREQVIDPLDHACMIWDGSPDPAEHSLAALLEGFGMKIARVDYRPTAENMAVRFREVLTAVLEARGICVAGLTVWETPGSFAQTGEG